MKLNFYEVKNNLFYKRKLIVWLKRWINFKPMITVVTEHVPPKGHIVSFDNITDYVVFDFINKTNEADVFIFEKK